MLFGNPSVGKTHLAIGLGIEACLSNKTVLFISVPNLMIELKEAMNLNQIQKYKRNFEKYDLVILYELDIYLRRRQTRYYLTYCQIEIIKAQ
ncbi:MAG: ATP-binding protein [Bacilli bacterium]